jgi:hypothetical protein
VIKQQMVDRYGDDVRVDFCMRYGNPRPNPKCEWSMRLHENLFSHCTRTRWGHVSYAKRPPLSGL